MLKSSFQSRSVEPFYTGGKVSLTADGQKLATTYNEFVVVTDLTTGEQTHKIEGDGEVITTLEISPDGEYLVTCSRSLQMHIYRLKENGEYTKTKSQKAHASPVMTMTIDPTSTLLATGGAEGGVKVWDIKGGYTTHDLKGHGGVISALKFYGRTGSTEWKLASGSDDGKIRVWDLVRKVCLHVLDSHVSIVRGLDFNENGSLLLSGARDSVVLLWDTRTGKQKKVLPVKESVEAVGFLTEDAVYFGGENGEVRLWSLSSSAQLRSSSVKIVQTSEEVNVVDILKDGDTLYSILSDQTIIRLDSNLEVLRRIAGTHGEIIDCCYLGPEQLAIATNSPEVRVISVDNMLDCKVLAGHTDIVLSIDRSVDGNWLATAGKDRLAKLWKRNDDGEFEEYATFQGHTGAIGAVALPRGPSQGVPKFLITGSADETVKVWNVKTQSVALQRRAHEKDINAIDVSPDDRWFATASQDRTVKIWDTETCETVGILRGHRRGVWSVKFSQYDKVIATASSDKTVRIWNLNDYSCTKTLEGHSNTVLKVDWITQGAQVVSAGSDGLVKVWDTKSGECSVTLDNHEDKVWSLAVRDDDTGFVSGGGDSVITIWNDITQEVEAERDEQKAQEVEKVQRLANLIREQDWKQAFLAALDLNHPRELLLLCQRLVPHQDDLTEVISWLDADKIAQLLDRVRDWNTTARTSQVAQAVLQTILKTRPIEELVAVRGIVKTVNSILPYSERHWNRMDELLEQTYTLDYVLKEMEILL